jgi:baculoviral IAP repeat-containing protein 6
MFFFLADTYAFTYEDDSGKVGFTCPFHYQTHVEVATAASQDASRSRRLAQEISTLSTSLPISSSSTVFVRCDEERLDVMKVWLG